VNDDFANIAPGSEREQPMRRHDLAARHNGKRYDGSLHFVRHFECTALELHQLSRSRPSSLRECCQMYALLQPVHSSLERLDLRSSVGPIDTHVLGAHNSLAEDGDLLQLLLGHELVVAPPDRGPDEGDVHPAVVIANKHGRLVLLVEIQQDVPILHPRKVARQPQEAGAPNMAEEYRKATFGVQLAARNEVEQLCH